MQAWAAELGFSRIGVSDLDVADASARLRSWLDAGMHGSMHWLERHAELRAQPDRLVPGALRVVTVRMDYLPRDLPAENDGWRNIEWQRIDDEGCATVSVYARGRDYHKVMRARLQQFADRIAAEVGPFGHRAFTDSGPVLEVEMAARSGLAWRGKHTLALSRDAGSMFFLGELFVDLPFEPTPPADAHCGTCSACIDVCPTRAIVAPYVLDARRCIAYLTIEHEGPIPLELRPLIGNRVFGCDDCQLACPWNKHAQRAVIADFDPKAWWGGPPPGPSTGLETGRSQGAPAPSGGSERSERGGTGARLLELWQWDEATFLSRTEGTVLRRSGFERWRRNLAVAMGNALRARPPPGEPPRGAANEVSVGALRLRSEQACCDEARMIEAALRSAQHGASALVAEHIEWALAQAAPDDHTGEAAR
jgi:epoxyqueuosine reductase